jgi:hypothetical protein
MPDHVRVSLDLLDARRFNSGMVYVRYRLRHSYSDQPINASHS